MFPTIYVDESASQIKVPAVLAAHGFRVQTRHDVFSHVAELDDPTWLSYCGEHGWVALTKDKAIKRRPAELRMLRVARVRMFTIAAGHLTGDDQADLVVRAMASRLAPVL